LVFIIRIYHEARSSECQTYLYEIRTSDVYRYIKEAYGTSVLYDLWVWHVYLNKANGGIVCFIGQVHSTKLHINLAERIQEQKAKWHLNFPW